MIDFASSDGGNQSVRILSRNPADAAPTFAALLQLAAKGEKTQRLDVDVFDVEHSSLSGMQQDKIFFPLLDETVTLERPIGLNLQNFVLTKEALKLLLCCSRLTFDGCSIVEEEGSTTAADDFVNAIVGGNHQRKCEKITLVGEGLEMASTAMRKLAKWDGLVRDGVVSVSEGSAKKRARVD